jgi:hypothetical protein
MPAVHISKPAAPAFKIEVMRDGTSRNALNFGADGKAIRPAASEDKPAPEPESEAQAEPSQTQINPAKTPADAVANKTQPVHASLVAAAPVAGPNDPAMGFEGPDAKTIQVH